LMTMSMCAKSVILVILRVVKKRLFLEVQGRGRNGL